MAVASFPLTFATGRGTNPASKGMPMRSTIWIPIALAAFLLPASAGAQQESPPGHPAHACPAGEECPAPPDHEAMQARHQAMMEMHEESAARLQELQDEMHAATGEAKVDAIEALLDELLAQQRAMHAMMMGMHPMGTEHEMMKHEGMESDESADR
jgi:hypothetical protein